MKLIGVDVGGTFTDLVYVDTEAATSAIHKVATTPHDPSEGVLAGVVELCKRAEVAPGSIDHVLHGTTIATNAILEYDGVEAGMITNEGYRDIIHIGRHQRPQHYSIMQEVPWQDRPLIKRRYRKTVTARVAPPFGEVMEPLDEEGVRRAARELKESGIDSIAICFLFAYLNPEQELRAQELVLEEHPECFVTTSSSVSPQFREFERFTTTAMNAFIGPKVRTYVARLEADLAAHGLSADLHIMCSNGGVATAEMVAARPVLTLLSGPAAGVLGGGWAGALSARDHVITFDVGGTSADIGIVRGGIFEEASARDTAIAGYPLLVPMIDIHTIGAGGGSIAYVDAGGAFCVGPRSAGARPGPAAYGHGGEQPTVTDANVVLGRLDGENFLGGEMELHAEASMKVVSGLAETLGMTPEATADGIMKIVNANMANLIRSRTVQKGLDPREFSLVAFGGGGPLQAVDVAAELGIPEVIIPPAPGITSAMGLITTDLKYDAVRTAFISTRRMNLEALQKSFSGMEGEIGGQFHADGLSPDEYHFERSADLRYVGQGYELRVTVPGGDLDEAGLESMFAEFADKHLTEYGHVHAEDPIEIVNVRVTGIGVMPKLHAPVLKPRQTLEEALIRRKECVFRKDGELQSLSTPLYLRDALPVDQEIPGPAIIIQKDTTSIVRPQDRMIADSKGNLIIKLGVEG